MLLPMIHVTIIRLLLLIIQVMTQWLLIIAHDLLVHLLWHVFILVERALDRSGSLSRVKYAFPLQVEQHLL